MFLKIKTDVEKELISWAEDIDRLYPLSSTSPLIFNTIKEFVLGNGKRIRPVLFVLAYLGFSKKAAGGLYRSAVSFELMHDYMLVHDDIIDKSDTRRGKPSVHARFNKYLSGYKNLKFNGQD